MKKKKSSMPQAAMATPASSDMDKKYRAEDGLRTLKRYNEMCRDKGLMKDVKSLARQEMKDLAKVVKPKRKV